MLTFYTDGSCEPNPGQGGFSVIKVITSADGSTTMEPVVLGGEPSGGQTTNIRMEGLALVAALKEANGEQCEIYTDSEFWINVITKWSLAWEQKNWVKKGGEIKNLDIVKEVCPLYRSSKATLTWTRGHAGDPGNEMADHWANEARKKLTKAK
jgi:ribonuclease HI